jgi:predicted Zn-dependent peptidase
VIERHEAPVVSFHTYVNVGSVDDPGGETGLAHMFEHMAFKGTSQIGTKDYPAEKAALAKVDAAYHAYDAERRNPAGSDPAKLDSLKKAFKDSQDAADAFIEKNEFSSIVDRAGGVGMNASTNSDQTVYFYSLPANKLELWAYLESSRFRDGRATASHGKHAGRAPDRAVRLDRLLRPPVQTAGRRVHERSDVVLA